MNASYQEFRLATRSSRLARLQADEATRLLTQALPQLSVRQVVMDTPGDRDKQADLRTSAPDFFTRDLHEVVFAGGADCAVHSAKDLEDDLPDGIDWFWLPHPADPRDVLVLRTGMTVAELPTKAVVGVSSERREAYCRQNFPDWELHTIRGTIDERLAQLDAGDYDVLVMAAAALLRMDLKDRISVWISITELAPPEGQGHLALTFRAGDERFLRLRGLFVSAVVFAGAGCRAGQCTMDASAALARCDVCLYDTLLDHDLLRLLPPHAHRIAVGKRSGGHGVTQESINDLLVRWARRGRRVVRLKGGDPGVFGRLTEEVEALERLHLPYRVLPGISSLLAATTGTGMLLTSRGFSSGFTVITPRKQRGEIGSVAEPARAQLPLVIFMATEKLRETLSQLLEEGFVADTPAAMIFAAGTTNEKIIRGDLKNLPARVEDAFPRNADGIIDGGTARPPGLILVGAPAATDYRRADGGLMGCRVLLPGSATLSAASVACVHDLGGIPLPLPLVRLTPERDALTLLKTIRSYDWLIIPSPTAARILVQLLPESGLDLRALPLLAVSGPGTAAVCRELGLLPDLVPASDYGTTGLVAAVQKNIPAGSRVMRLRSHVTDDSLSSALTTAGYWVTDCVLYRNEFLRPKLVPEFDAVFFASASAVASYCALRGAGTLASRRVVAMGQPTVAALLKQGISHAIIPAKPSVTAALWQLGCTITSQELERRQ